jgi:hypothetical protein
VVTDPGEAERLIFLYAWASAVVSARVLNDASMRVERSGLPAKLPRCSTLTTIPSLRTLLYKNGSPRPSVLSFYPSYARDGELPQARSTVVCSSKTQGIVLNSMITTLCWQRQRA